MQTFPMVPCHMSTEEVFIPGIIKPIPFLDERDTVFKKVVGIKTWHKLFMPFILSNINSNNGSFPLGVSHTTGVLPEAFNIVSEKDYVVISFCKKNKNLWRSNSQF